MALSQLVPITVSAKVVLGAAEPVPALDGAPFDVGTETRTPAVEQPVQAKPAVEQPVQAKPVQEQAVLAKSVQDQPVLAKPILEQPILEQPILERPILERPVEVLRTVLEPGVHVHWALPDVLTASSVDTDKGVTMFPGVPDLWLVVRVSPGPAPTAANARRPWKAWVVDSILGKAVELEKWSALDRDITKIHTLAGMLDRAGLPGYGVWPKSDQSFDPAMAVYYPQARKRFGLYDSLSDLPDKSSGELSYTVIGWYSVPSNDLPALNFAKSAGVSEDLAMLSRSSEIATRTVAASQPPAPPWNPAGMTAQQQPAPTADKTLEAKKKAAQFASMHAAQAGALDHLVKALKPAVDAVSVGAVAHEFFLYYTVCHGSVMGVQLAPQPAPKPLRPDDVVVYPSIKRAMAELVSPSPDQTDYVEMLLQGLDCQKGTPSGICDLPGAVHALAFQGMPGGNEYFLKMEIGAAANASARIMKFDLQPATFMEETVSSGHYPTVKMGTEETLTSLDPSLLLSPVRASLLDSPLETEVGAFRNKVTAAFQNAKTAFDNDPTHKQLGQTVDGRLVIVIDHRKNAQPLRLGPIAHGGSDAAAYWIDMGQDAEDSEVTFRRLLIACGSAALKLPTANNVHRAPSPRWYRPWSPQVVVKNASRSYKFGFDGRFDPGDALVTRSGGSTVSALLLSSNPPVFGRDLILNPEPLFGKSGIPADVRPLVYEALLLDPDSAAAMAAAVPGSQNKTALANLFQSAVISLLNSCDPSAPPVTAVEVTGQMPSGVALTRWQDPRDPLFIDVQYNFSATPFVFTGAPFSSPYWHFDEGCAEFTSVTGPNGPIWLTENHREPVLTFSERSRLTPTLMELLRSAIVSATTVDPYGNPAPKQAPPSGFDSDTFLKSDVLSAPLTRFDAMLMAKNHAVRAGYLKVTKLSVVDIFGLRREWIAGGGWTELTPRLPYWARMNFRLLSTDKSTDVLPAGSPICGILVPDCVDFALEVFDGLGHPIGELTTDYGKFLDQVTMNDTFQVSFQLFPWVQADPAADPISAIQDPTLQSLVRSIVAQSMPADFKAAHDKAVSQNTDVETVLKDTGQHWFESSLSALLRSIAIIRSKLDPGNVTPNRLVPLLGAPILVMNARVSFDCTTDEVSSIAAGAPKPLDVGVANALPDIPVRIGDMARPDDGVLGCFDQNRAPGYLLPVVSAQAMNPKVVNGVTEVGAADPPITHQFVSGANRMDPTAPCDTGKPVSAKGSWDVVILADMRHALYASCGVLPRKKVVVPRECLDAALRNLQPALPVGPLMTTPSDQAFKPLIPPPDIENVSASLSYEEEDAAVFHTVPVGAAPPLGELPQGRVSLAEGWILISPNKTVKTAARRPLPAPGNAGLSPETRS